MATKKRTVKSKPKAAKPATSIATTKAAGSRKLKANKYRSFRLSKPIKSPHEKLPNSFRIFAVSLKILRDNWKPFLGIVLIYGVLMVILVRGLGGGIQLDFLKATFQKAAKGTFNSVTNSLSLFAYLVGTAGNSQSDAGSVYQAILILVISLATIWGLRQVIAGTKVRIRDTFYRGMYPLIPFILVLVVIALQLLPLIIGNWFFHIVMANSIAVTLLEKFLWGLLFALLALLSIYMVCSSVFALYIVTLPDMTPLKALRSARQLVLHRRWSVIRKVLFLPIILIIISAIIMVPLILWLTPAAQWIFFGLTMVTLVVVHSYMYTLYRELL